MTTTITRREFIARASAACAAASGGAGIAAPIPAENDMLIIDTHQHLWNTTTMKPAWIEAGPELMRHEYMQAQYAEATRGLTVKSVYMEVDMEPQFHDREAESVIAFCKSGEYPTVAAVIGGRPASADFEAYVKRHLEGGYVKGLRQVLHPPQMPAGFCLGEDFVKGIHILGNLGLRYDLCLRPTELMDGAKLAGLCPETRFVVDHCGNADVKAFDPKLVTDTPPEHKPDEWKRSMEAMAQRPNVICKISGVIARLPKGAPTEALAPIVNHCLDTFGPDRVVFGGDWPVCLSGGPLRKWVDGLRQIVASRSVEDQRRLWHENAVKFYGLKL